MKSEKPQVEFFVPLSRFSFCRFIAQWHYRKPNQFKHLSALCCKAA
ncbi:MAG TPA: hypothetical protein IAD32_05470 [Candidatus Scatavimonas merdigallinarum]|uniref:Uncharacterized protein n=1 Tax=Candidatus Scatavimonas merdigallinarum TaxID=2840914 RepID=A0A9D1CVR1_9FIRM|nr:hypothetical protein [Candidatus Scatavimonas merdigallinarum]